MFTALNTRPLYVESVLATIPFKQDTSVVFLERNSLNLQFVANNLRNQVTLLHTAEITAKRNCTVFKCQQCGRMFNEFRSFNTHMTVHTGATYELCVR